MINKELLRVNGWEPAHLNTDTWYRKYLRSRPYQVGFYPDGIIVETWATGDGMIKTEERFLFYGNVDSMGMLNKIIDLDQEFMAGIRKLNQ